MGVENLCSHEVCVESHDLVSKIRPEYVQYLFKPGTGKTLTVESVAEIAERPLYRVTCGDFGIKPEEVEKYLEFVLHATPGQDLELRSPAR